VGSRGRVSHHQTDTVKRPQATRAAAPLLGYCPTTRVNERLGGIV
jgi:hypothetical protein